MKNELQTMRLFSPLFPHIYLKNEWGRYIDTACVPMKESAVKIIVDGNEAYSIEGENTLHKVSDLNAVAAKPGKILYDNAVDFPSPHHVEKFLNGGTLKVCPTVSVVSKLQDFHVSNALHRIGVSAKYVFLVLNT